MSDALVHGTHETLIPDSPMKHLLLVLQGGPHAIYLIFLAAFADLMVIGDLLQRSYAPIQNSTIH